MAAPMVAESWLSPNDLIWPLFVIPGKGEEQEVTSLPGVFRRSVDRLCQTVGQAIEAGIPAIALFPVTPTERKTADGREALNPDNLICTATRAVREQFGDAIGIVCDVALDPYTTHGQDGLLLDGQVANDATLEVLQQQAVNQAAAGASVIAPSDMMDGRIGAIRASSMQPAFLTSF